MKFLVRFCALFALIFSTYALTDEQKEKLNVYSKECKTQSGVTQDLIERGRNGELVDDLTLKKQIVCVMKKIGMATASGELDVEYIRNRLKKVSGDDEEVERIIKKCVVTRDTPEQTAFEVSKCLLEQKPKFSPVD
ncbi:PBP GOBP domain containing protein [Asbolus verrucosus]|uniref:PBP GOBP domain containing protein n=1 Tax=Asbolus verrucosus TaxID=1661398 RepID=A0A482W2D9_ASBVE|nr:PBP GOBP domain containing protein [Asbolus verrucosus]